MTATTVMMRDVPNRYTAEELLAKVIVEGFQGCFDLFYLPTHFSTMLRYHGRPAHPEPVVLRSTASRLPPLIQGKALTQACSQRASTTVASSRCKPSLLYICCGGPKR